MSKTIAPFCHSWHLDLTPDFLTSLHSQDKLFKKALQGSPRFHHAYTTYRWIYISKSFFYPYRWSQHLALVFSFCDSNLCSMCLFISKLVCYCWNDMNLMVLAYFTKVLKRYILWLGLFYVYLGVNDWTDWSMCIYRISRSKINIKCFYFSREFTLEEAEVVIGWCMHDIRCVIGLF